MSFGKKMQLSFGPSADGGKLQKVLHVFGLWISLSFFARTGFYSVFDTDIDKVPSYSLRDVIEKNGWRELRVSLTRIEELIRLMLVEKKIGVQEYEGTTLVRERFHGDWKDFVDLLLGMSAVPSIMAVGISDVVEISFLITSEPIIYACSFEDDDVFSNLYGIMNEMNFVEVIYENKRLAEFLCRTGVVTHLRKARVTHSHSNSVLT